MLRYTARNGTTFHFNPDYASEIEVMGDGAPMPLDLDDVREFLLFLDDHLDAQTEMMTDADLTAVGPD